MITDILLSGKDIDTNIQENVRLFLLIFITQMWRYISPTRVQDGQLSSSVLREQIYVLQNLFSKQELMLTSEIR